MAGNPGRRSVSSPEGGEVAPPQTGHPARSGSRWSPAAIGAALGGAVVAVVLLIVLVAVTTGPGASPDVVAVPASVVREVTTVPASVLDQVGIGGHPASSQPEVNPLDALRGGAAGLAAAGGKPVFFFYGAEWCPYCAAERWSIIVALSRFGTFSGLRGTSSSRMDYAPNTQTFTFYGASYSSPFLAFLPVEAQNAAHAPLQSPDTAEADVLKVWDPPRQVPFVDVAGRYLGGLPGWVLPSMLAGMSRAKIAASLWDPSSSVARALDANANYLTAAVCAVDGGRPGDVCTSPGVLAAAAQLSAMPRAVPVP